MKRQTNNKRRWIVLNALFLALAVVITINLLETGGLPAESPEAAVPSVEVSVTPEPAEATAATTPEAAAPEETPEPEATPAPEVKTGTQSFSMRFVGDLMCCDYQMADALQADGSYDFIKHFAQIKNELQGADVLLGNFEACMYSGAPLNGTIVGFNAPLDYAEALKDCNFDVLFTSNNHAMDFLVPGAFETTQKLQEMA